MKIPKGHVARSIAKGQRPFLTCTIAPETFVALDMVATALGLSRGRVIDLAVLLVQQDAARKAYDRLQATIQSPIGLSEPSEVKVAV